MTEITHTPFSGNRENLQKLIDGAKAFAAKFPDQFDMETFNSCDAGPLEAANKIHNCGTAACFAGIGPTVPGLEATEGTLCWDDYIKQNFGLVAAPDLHGDWQWLFAPDWGWTDEDRDTGSIWHAIARAEYALQVGIPSNWEAQVTGYDEITYREYVKEQA